MRHSSPDTVSWQTDEELMQFYVSTEDSDAFTLLNDRYRDSLIQYISLRGHTFQDAEDIVQETFTAVFTKAEQWDGRRVRPWIFTIAANKAIDYWRKNQRRVHAPDDLHGTEHLKDEKMCTSAEQYFISETQELVRKILAFMTAAEQKLLWDVFFDHLKQSEIAEQLDVPIGTVKSRIHNAIARLRKIAEKQGMTGKLLDAA